MIRTRLYLMLAGLAGFAAGPAATGAITHDKAQVTAGKRAFQKCYGCHALDPAETGAQGPSLEAIVGRPVASATGYDYSPAMRAFAARETVWSREALDAFLADPQKVVPGNEMGFFGIRDAQERAALIEYLAAH